MTIGQTNKRDVPQRAAFFDVDETLITSKSMFDFLRFWLARSGDDGRTYRQLAEQRRARARSGVPRTEINREYYRGFAGEFYEDVMAAGRAWYDDYRARPDAFVAAAVHAAIAHRATGDVIVLVSGSFRACLGSFAADLGAHKVLCSEPLVGQDGQLTGEIVRPMIGEAKGDAVAETLARLELRGADCFAYADHSSDLAMLTAVGHPRVVGDDPMLTAEARAHGWPILPATPAPHWSARAA